MTIPANHVLIETGDVSIPIAAAALKQSYAVTWAQLLRGELEGSKTPRGWRITRASFEAALERRRRMAGGHVG